MPRRWKYTVDRSTKRPDILAAVMPYPTTNGSEPCVGRSRMFLYDKSVERTPQPLEQIEAMRFMCAGCHVLTQCREWAIAAERFGFYGQTTPEERDQIRKTRGQACVEPQTAYTWGLGENPFYELPKQCKYGHDLSTGNIYWEAGSEGRPQPMCADCNTNRTEAKRGRPRKGAA